MATTSPAPVPPPAAPPAPATDVHHIAILTEEWGCGLPFDSLPWRGWIHTRREDRSENLRLAVHRWIRESGYLNRGATVPVLTLHVYDWFQSGPQHPNGRPIAIESTTFNLRPK